MNIERGGNRGKCWGTQGKTVKLGTPLKKGKTHRKRTRGKEKKSGPEARKTSIKLG